MVVFSRCYDDWPTKCSRSSSTLFQERRFISGNVSARSVFSKKIIIIFRLQSMQWRQKRGIGYRVYSSRGLYYGAIFLTRELNSTPNISITNAKQYIIHNKPDEYLKLTEISYCNAYYVIFSNVLIFFFNAYLLFSAWYPIEIGWNQRNVWINLTTSAGFACSDWLRRVTCRP